MLEGGAVTKWKLIFRGCFWFGDHFLICKLPIQEKHTNTFVTLSNLDFKILLINLQGLVTT